VSTHEPGGDIEALSRTVERLRQENEQLREAEHPVGPGKGSRWRRIFSWVLVVVACFLAVLSVVVVFGRNQLLNTDTYVTTVTPLASNQAIQEAVAQKVSEQLIERTDVKERVRKALPRRAAFLATPIAVEVENATGAITLKLVESPAFQTLWVSANRAAHKQLVNLLTGSSHGALTSGNGTISIDLAKVEANVKKQLDARGITVFNKVSVTGKSDSFVLFQSDQLARFQRLTRVLNHLSVVLPIVTLLCFAGGIVLAANRRKGLVRAAAGLALSMALILVVLAVLRNQYLNSLGPSRSRAANAALIDTVTVELRDLARTVLIVAAVLAVAAVLFGNRQLRSWWARREMPAWTTGGPVHRLVVDHRSGLQWSVVALGLVILVIWGNPTALVAVVVVLVTLAAVGAIGVLAAQKPRPDGPFSAPTGVPALGPGEPLGPDEVRRRGSTEE
jgi:hypothetical protein